MRYFLPIGVIAFLAACTETHEPAVLNIAELRKADGLCPSFLLEGSLCDAVAGGTCTRPGTSDICRCEADEGEELGVVACGATGPACPEPGTRCRPGDSQTCTDGTQCTCERTSASSRSYAWSCIATCVPETEICDDAVDNDCDGEIDEDCAPGCVPEAEVCDDAVDNDCDGEIDEDCAPPPACTIAEAGPIEVSGGIYEDTVWCAQNSPIRVTGDVVVFDGVSLTVREGVRVEVSDGMGLEVRSGGSMRTLGTETEPVTFTSASATPTRGSWGEITFAGTVAEFNHTVFEYGGGSGTDPYARTGVIAFHADWLSDRRIRNSVFRHNGTGPYCLVCGGPLLVEDSLFEDNGVGALLETGVYDRCEFRNNDAGVFPGGRINDSLIHDNGVGINGGRDVARTVIWNNDIGVRYTEHLQDNTVVQNRIGLDVANGAAIVNNNICDNSEYGLRLIPGMTGSIGASNNYWCTTDAAAIAASIYDGRDDVSLGLVTFEPFLTEPAVGAPAIP